MPAPKTVDELLDLVQKSGLVEESRLNAFVAKLRSDDTRSPEKLLDLASLLVRDGFLTVFQVNQLLIGKWRGFTLARYKVLEQLGSGRASSVYLCEHEQMSKKVAVKVLPTAIADDPASLERFYREGRALAALHHPNVVRAYDITQHDGLTMLVMEYVDGSTLEHITAKGGPIAVTRAAHYLRQAALGLQHAHETAGIVHRDIKPADIMVDRYGVVKIIDFGLARFSTDAQPMLPVNYDQTILGTPDYMAPEQTNNPHTVDIRADIYSLGATFYFCLTGRSPFPEGKEMQKLMWQRTRLPVPLRMRRPEVPEQFATLIDRMMAKEPANRPQTPQEVAHALAPFTIEAIGPPSESEMPQLCPAALGGQQPVNDAIPKSLQGVD